MGRCVTESITFPVIVPVIAAAGLAGNASVKSKHRTTSVDVAAPFVGELGLHGSSHDVVDDSDRGSLLQDQSRGDQFHQRCGEPILGPAADGDEILDRRLPPEHGDRLQEHRSIGARRRQTVGDDARDIRVDVPGPSEELAPER